MVSSEVLNLRQSLEGGREIVDNSISPAVSYTVQGTIGGAITVNVREPKTE
jgi:hypothetical protein